MSRMIRLSLAALSVLAVALMLATPSVTIASGGVQAGETKVEGTVTAVDAANLKVSIKQQNGTTVVVQAAGGTKIERNGVRVPLSAFKVGDRGQAIISANGIARKLEAVGN